MKKLLSRAALALCLMVLTASSPLAADTEKKADFNAMDIEDRVSYAIGYNLINQLKNSLSVNPDLIYQGMKDHLAGTPAATPEEIQKTMMDFQAIARKNQAAARKKQGEQNRASGRAFLAANKEKQGVETLASGLQYKVLKAGSGISPALDDKVKCHYKGTLINGREFDSSHKRGEPAVFPVKGVIKGWTEALQLMKVGAKWMLYVPPDLAYGDNGAGPAIGPGATLIFEVELLGIE